MRLRLLLMPMALTAALIACEAVDCISTQLTARDASMVAAPDVARSGVLQATLTARERPLPGMTVVFSAEDSPVFDGDRLGDADTGRTGVAKLDLKGTPIKAVKAATSGSYSAEFRGNGTYCPSVASATLDIATAG